MFSRTHQTENANSEHHGIGTSQLITSDLLLLPELSASIHVFQCWLRHLSVDIFKDLVNLIELDLSDNIVTSLPNDIFISLTHLTLLNIKGNRVMAISDKVLRPLHYMRQLTIGSNMHMNLTLGDEFLNMTQLTHLVLSNIKLPSLNSDNFRQLRHCPLVEVDMSRCHITSVQTAAQPYRGITT